MNTLNLFNADIVLIGKPAQVANKKTNNLKNTLALEDRKVFRPASIYSLDSSFYSCFEHYNFLIFSSVLKSQLILGKNHLLTLLFATHILFSPISPLPISLTIITSLAIFLIPIRPLPISLIPIIPLPVPLIPIILLSIPLSLIK